MSSADTGYYLQVLLHTAVGSPSRNVGLIGLASHSSALIYLSVYKVPTLLNVCFAQKVVS